MIELDSIQGEEEFAVCECLLTGEKGKRLRVKSAPAL